MGVPAKDCGVIGQVLGERIVLNEFVGYLDLSGFVQAHPGQLAERSVTLSSYALCGFANFGSIAIQIGGHRRPGPGPAARSRTAGPALDGGRAPRVLPFRVGRRRAD